MDQEIINALRKANHITIDAGYGLYEGGYLDIRGKKNEGGYILPRDVPTSLVVGLIEDLEEVLEADDNGP